MMQDSKGRFFVGGAWVGRPQYDPSDLPCELCSPEAQEVGQEPAGARSDETDEPSTLETFLWRLSDAISEAATSLADARKR